MAFTIPPSQGEHLQNLANLHDEEWARILAALQEARPSFSAEGLALLVAESSGFSHLELVRHLSIVLPLYQLAESFSWSAEQMAEEVVEAAKRQKLFSLNVVQAKVFTTRLKQALELHDVIGVTAKALDVLLQDKHPFQEARVITDFRPIFSDKAEALASTVGLIVHSLKLTVRGSRNEEENFFVAMDSDDLREIQAVLERAAQKEKVLTSALEDGGISCIRRSD